MISSTIRTDGVNFVNNENVCFMTQYGSSPLHVAAEKGHTDVVNILVTHGANVDTLDWVSNL